MGHFSRLQRTYLVGSTILGVTASLACVVVAFRQPISAAQWAIAISLAIIYGLLWFQREEFATLTPGSPVLVEVSSTALLAALVLVGPPAVPLLLVADTVARSIDRGWHQPLGYLFNLNQLATNAVVTLATITVLTEGDPRVLSTFPRGTIAIVLILAVSELVARLNHLVLVSVGTRQPIRVLLAQEARPLALVTIIPPAMGLLIAAAAVVSPGLVLPLLIPVVLSRYAIRAIARWSKRHVILKEQVAEQTASLRAQTAQLEALEQTRHQHTLLLVHDLEKEFRLGERLVHDLLASEALLAEPGARLRPVRPTLAEIAAIFQRGLAMCADMLLGSTLRAGQAIYQPAQTNLTALVAAVTGRYLPVAEAADVRLSLHCDEVLFAQVDAAKLDRALANLLTNAIDYTKGCPERQVTVTLGQDAATSVIEVRDTGIGVEPEASARIGQRFSRLVERQESHHGYGLGLYGVAAIMIMHSGSVELHSPGRDLGTAVTLRLPQSIPGQTALTLPTSHPVGGAELNGNRLATNRLRG